MGCCHPGVIRPLVLTVLVCALLSRSALSAFGGDAPDYNQIIAELRKQNELLRDQVHQQKQTLDDLSEKVASLEGRMSDQESSVAPSPKSREFGDDWTGRIHLSGEGGVGFFDTGARGAYPNSEFRVDEARIFVDAAIWGDVYGFLELNLATREAQDLETYLGEAYVDFENVSQLWGQDGMLGIRAGRMDVPFGEEYLYRDAIDNPLISHSLMDFWGIDEGVELYGALGPVDYIIAVLNGSIETTRDLGKDKSVVARLGFNPLKRVHVGLSAMRTGELNPTAGEWSELWFGNAFFRSIGSAATTEFHVDLAQADVRVRLPHGHLHFAGGVARYDDDDPAADNQRDFWFWSAEAVHDLTQKLYAGARFSQIVVNDGYPLVGQGNFGTYFFGSPTDELWRLSLGLGYRFSENLVFKTEYSIERGQTLSGDDRDEEDMFSAEAAFKF